MEPIYPYSQLGSSCSTEEKYFFPSLKLLFIYLMSNELNDNAGTGCLKE